MKIKKEYIRIIDSLLEGEHNLNNEQKQQLIEIKKSITKSKTYENLKVIAIEFLRFFGMFFKDS